MASATLPHCNDTERIENETGCINQSVLGMATDLCVFRPRTTRFAVIIPIWNEGQIIIDQLYRMGKAACNVDIILCDSGSRDGSTDRERLEFLGVRTLLVTDQIGLGTALRLGIAYALDQGYDGVITIDGNGKDGVESIPEFEARLSNGYDFVQGSRFMVGGKNRNTPWDRYLGIRFLIAPIMRFASGFHYTDPTNGFKGLRNRGTHYLASGDKYFHFLVVVGYVAFIVYFTYSYRDFAAMKTIYMFPGLLSFAVMLQEGVRLVLRALGRHENRIGVVAFILASLFLCVLYTLNVELLIEHLERSL